MFCIILWWIPIWLVGPVLYLYFDKFKDDPSQAGAVTAKIIAIQSIIGLVGILVASKDMYTLIKNTPRKQTLPTMLRILRTGKQ